jgi:hypothetical protein
MVQVTVFEFVGGIKISRYLKLAPRLLMIETAGQERGLLIASPCFHSLQSSM